MADDAAAPSGELSKPASEPIEPTSELDDDDAAEKPGTESPADGATDEDEARGEAEDEVAGAEDGTAAPRLTHLRLATIVGVVVVVVLGGLTGWLGFRAHESRNLELQRQTFLQVGRQGAVNLTTLDYEHIDTDVQRILDSATGTFYDDFQQRAPSFVEVVKQVKSKSVGTVTAAALESDSPTDAQVLVAVTVKSVIVGQPDQPPRAWRMRILVQKIDDQTKVSNVEFVP